jgi:hypothetical protein
MALFQQFGERLHVEIGGLEKGVCALYGADGSRQDGGLRPGLLGDPLDQLEVAPRFRDDRFHAVLFHQVDELDDVIRGRRDAGPLFDGADLDETEAGEKVGPHRVVDDDGRALVGREHLVPATHGLIDTGEELLAVALEGGAVLGRDAHEAFEDVLRDGAAGFASFRCFHTFLMR